MKKILLMSAISAAVLASSTSFAAVSSKAGNVDPANYVTLSGLIDVVGVSKSQEALGTNYGGSSTYLRINGKGPAHTAPLKDGDPSFSITYLVGAPATLEFISNTGGAHYCHYSIMTTGTPGNYQTTVSAGQADSSGSGFTCPSVQQSGGSNFTPSLAVNYFKASK